LKIFIKWLIYTILIIFVAWIIPGISVDNFFSAMLACLVIGFINIFIKPVVQLVSLPVTFLTLGLFAVVINALLLMLAGIITPGFTVEGFFSALFGSIILSVFTSIINKSDK
jgi:putative membrane protein